MAQAKPRTDKRARATPAAKVAARRRGVTASKPFSDRGQVSEMQRARLLSAAVPVVDGLGWSGVTVADIASRARVSRRTFYDLFANREECLLAVLDDTVEHVERDLAVAVGEGFSWVERVRAGLWTILSFLDRDPVLARVCVVQSACGSRRALKAREEILGRFARTLEKGAAEESTRGAEVPSLTAEGLIGAAVAIVYKRLLNGERAPLTDLHGELMGMIVLPYLGAAAAIRERKCPAPAPLAHADGEESGRASSHRDPLREIPMRLTYRTARVLKATAEHPGASNRQIGEHSDMYDQGQISKLLARLQRLGLLENSGEGQARGESNAWSLTALGERVTEQLSLSTTPSKQSRSRGVRSTRLRRRSRKSTGGSKTRQSESERQVDERT
jgi:AcrR family transcriptional regulator/DNA-binding MarR family transcriptional regulator